MILEEKQPLVTIGILTWNSIKVIKEVLNEILKLSYPNKEILVFDNGSTDGTIEFLANINDVHLIKSEKNLGYSAGKNQIAENAQGKYILLLDDDILVSTNNTIEQLIDLILKTNCGFVSVLLVNRNANSTNYYGGYWSMFGYSYKPPISLDFILKSEKSYHFCHTPEGGALFFERDHYLSTGGYNESQPYYLDVGDLGLRSYILTGKKIIVTNHLYFTHLGIERKKELQRWLFNLVNIVRGTFKVLFYNFTTINVIRYSFFLPFAFFAGTLTKCMEYKSLRPIPVYFKSIYLFIKELPDILKVRNDIQARRIVKTDDFLLIDRKKEIS